MAEQDPLTSFLSNLADKIKTTKEHKSIMDAVYASASDTKAVENTEDPFAKFLQKVGNALSSKIPEQQSVQPVVEVVTQDTSTEAAIVEEINNERVDPPTDNIADDDEPVKGLALKIREAIEKAKNKALTPAVELSKQENKADEPENELPGEQVASYISELEKIKDTGTVKQKEEAVSSLKELKEYVDKTVKDYSRKILELGSGGGTVAVQYANGGTMNGDLNINGHILSGGKNISDYFGSGGGGGGIQNLSFNESNAELSISNGNTISLSALSGKFTDRLVNGVYQVVLSGDGTITFPQSSYIGPLYDVDDSWFVTSPVVQGGIASADKQQYIQVNNGSDVLIGTGWPLAAHEWVFGVNGNLTLPGAIVTVSNSKLDFVSFGPNTAYLTTTPDDSTALFMGADVTELRAKNYVSIATNTSNTTHLWEFGADGGLRFPDNTTQTTAFTGIPDNIAYTNQDTVFEKNVTIQGNLTALGSSTFKNTIFTTTSALSVINTGPGPALYVFQAAGPYDVASFYDGDGVEVLHVGNANPSSSPKGLVGINESYPSVELTVSGQISASESITAAGGNSNQWNAAYTNLVTNSAIYLGTTRQYDYVQAGLNSFSYCGYAIPGTLTSSTGWIINRLYFSTAGTLISSGAVSNVIWNDRYTYSY